MLRNQPDAVFTTNAVRKAHAVRYPGRDNAMDLREHLRGSVLCRFGAKTVALAAMLGLAPTLRAADEENEKREVKVNPEDVQAIVEKYLKELGEGWGNEEQTKTTAPLTSNPEITVPGSVKQEEAGREIMGDIALQTVDTELLKQAAKDLFALYGIALKDGVSYTKDDVKFQVDGYDEKRRIGIELRSSQLIDYAQNEKGEWVQVEKPADAYLHESELPTLDKHIKDKKANILVLPLEQYSESVYSSRAMMNAYLQSIVDYLEWLRTSGRL